MKYFHLLLPIVLAMQGCKPDCLEGSDKQEFITKYYRSSFSQTNTAIATGSVDVTFTNLSKDYTMYISDVAISIRPALFGSPATRTIKDVFIVQPNSSQNRTYHLDVGDRVRKCYALESGIQFCVK